MKIKHLPIAIAALMLCACGGTNQNSSTNNQSASEYTPQQPTENIAAAPQKDYTFEVKRQWETDPDITSVTIKGDTVTICDSTVYHQYLINRSKSYEYITRLEYHWLFTISRINQSSPEYVELNLREFMSDVHNTTVHKKSGKVCSITKVAQSTFSVLSGEFVPRNYLDKHPVSKPIPEINFNIQYYFVYANDTAKMPPLLKNAKKLTIKDRKAIISDGSTETVVDIIPLSDYEENDLNYIRYHWFFVTKASNGVPQLRFDISSNVEEQVPNTSERLVEIGIDEVDCDGTNFHYKVKEFADWNNLRRGILSSYPDEEQHKSFLQQIEEKLEWEDNFEGDAPF